MTPVRHGDFLDCHRGFLVCHRERSAAIQCVDELCCWIATTVQFHCPSEPEALADMWVRWRTVSQSGRRDWR